MTIGNPGAWRRMAAIALTVVLPGCAAAPSQPTLVTSTPGSTAATSAPSASIAAPGPTSIAGSPTFPWARAGSFDLGGQLIGIAATPAGYVVVALPRTAWFSTDGVSWIRSVLPFEGGTSNGVELRAHANEVVGGPAGFLVVGGYDRKPCSESQGAGGPPPCAVGPIAWVSSDGLTWRSTQSEPIPADGSSLPAYSEIVHAWEAGDGWDAAVEARDSVRYHGNTLLHSVDGLAWSRLELPLPSGASSGDDVFAHAGVGAADGRRLVWQVQDIVDGRSGPVTTTLFISSDGASWTPLSAFDGTGVMVRLGLGPDDAAGRWLIFGDMVDGTGTARSWVSDDLVAWRASPPDAGLAGVPIPTSVQHWAGGYVALSGRDDSSGNGTWQSADGLTWSELPNVERSAIDFPTFLTMGPAGLLGVGEFDYQAQAWLAAET